VPKLLFGRVVKLTVTAEGAETVVLPGFDAEKNAGFDVDAHIIKSAEPDANKSVVRVFNLPDNLRKLFQGRGVKCAVEAGHKFAGNVASLGVFDVTRAWSELEEADWVTHFEGGEAHNALFDADISYSFSAGQTFGFVAKQIIQPLFDAGIGRGNFDKTLGASTQTFPNGACGEGKARDRLRSLAKKAGFEFSVQHSAFQFVKLGEANKAMIVNLSPSSGLIGVPAWGEADLRRARNRRSRSRPCSSLRSSRTG
jgi:hypothetical protein